MDINEYAFLIRHPSGRAVVHRDEKPAPLAVLEAIVDDELYDEPGTPGLWSTLDRHTTVERFHWLPVGTLPEDCLGVGVAVVTDAA